MRSVYDVIKRPIISEKSTALSELGGKYVFEVAPQANKLEIRDAVKRLFKVDAKDVRTQIVHGKVKLVGRFVSKRSNWKKAIVTLAPGQKIDFFKQK